MKKQQSGFTLIELIMVIVILGILSAFALPRFADLSSDAYAASRDGALGGMKSAAAIARAACLASSTCVQSAATSTVTIEGQSIDMVYGYPAGSATGIARAIDLSDYTLAHATGTTTVTITTNCTVTYAQPAAANGAPTFGGTTTGCP